MDDAERKALIGIAVLAARADEDKHEREHAEVEAIARVTAAQRSARRARSRRFVDATTIATASSSSSVR